MKESKKVLGFKVSEYKEHGYGHLEIRFATYRQVDMAETLAEAIRGGNGERIEHYVARSKSLAEAARTLTYYDHDYRTEFTAKWQCDIETYGRWYGLRVQMEMSPRNLKLAAKLSKAITEVTGREFGGSGADPHQFVEALKKLGAIPLRYVKTADYSGEDVEDTAFDVNVSIPPYVKPAEQAEEVAVA